MRYYLTFIYTCFTFFFTSVEAQTRATDLARYQITEVTLKNGLRVCLKQSSLEPYTFEFQLFAVEGYATLPISDQASAWVATDIGREAGLAQYTSDELENALDDHSVEMQTTLGPFDRQIEMTGPSTELPFCLHLICLLFTHPQFNEQSLKEVVAHTRQQLERKNKMSKLIMGSETFTKLNMRNWHIFSPFNSWDLNTIELAKVERLFKQFFSNPADFNLVLVGDFNSQEILPLLEESLGSLTAFPVLQPHALIPPAFPEGITQKGFSGIPRYQESYTYLTFPLDIQSIDPVTLDLLCICFKQRFVSEANSQEQWKKQLKISYRLPLFPYLKPLWLMIKFRSSADEVSSIRQAILKTLENIKQQGISEQEVKTAYLEFIMHKPVASNNAYEVAQLANYYRANWDILSLYALPDPEIKEKELFKKLKDCYPNLSQYSLISFHP